MIYTYTSDPAPVYLTILRARRDLGCEVQADDGEVMVATAMSISELASARLAASG